MSSRPDPFHDGCMGEQTKGGFITEVTFNDTKPVNINYKQDSSANKTQLLGTSAPMSSQYLPSGSMKRPATSAMGNRIRRSKKDRCSTVSPERDGSGKFGDRINDHIRLLHESWDRYIEEREGES